MNPDPVLNRTLLPHNSCFGCGHENPRGLHIEVEHDLERKDRLRGRFTPTEHMVGFPGIVHGGAIFTALDCLSTWVVSILGPDRTAAWILRSAETTYHSPAVPGQPLTLLGWIEERSGPRDPVRVRTEARRADDTLCVESEFKVLPLSAERLAEIAGLDAIPENWQQFLTP